ncbi:DUF4301 family protein, partial [uncultured Flavobacterium sp.]|uniref:DUF4301 family protein n=1 Tax=uncultured Flavobacterium sp. TaxID=165435 RepID=UPI0025F8026F
MEENCTKTKSASIDIVIYTNDPGNPTDIVTILSKFIDPDGRDMRRFAFHVHGDKELNNGTALHVISEKNPWAADMMQQFDSTDTGYLAIPGDDITAECKILVKNLGHALDLGFAIDDFIQMERCGITVEMVHSHLVIFRNGLPKVHLKKPALLNDGIFDMNEARCTELAGYFDKKKGGLKLTKFVPASGGASRMFRFVCEFLAEFDVKEETINAYINRRKDDDLRVFLIGLEKFPFFENVMAAARQKPGYAAIPKDLRSFTFVKTMLTDEAFDYANKPKGILPFHQYNGFTATPVHEHLKEAAAYAGADGKANVHFTISEEHLDGFRDAVATAKKRIEPESGIAINVDFSYQHKQTDTIAVGLDNLPFRTGDGKLLFRPGGHGALIQNLNELDADIVFVKNIDNVSLNHISVIALYKKALAGLLIGLQEQVFECVRKIEAGNVTEQELRNMFAFAMAKLSIDVPEDIMKFTYEHRLEFARKIFNRP